MVNDKDEDSLESEESKKEEIEDEQEEEDGGTEQGRDNMQAGGWPESQ